MSSRFFEDPASHAVYSGEKMGKAGLFQGQRAMVGLNAFEPGQQHALHAHEDSEKVYVVLEGTGKFRIGDEERRLGVGAVAVAPEGVLHGVHNDGEGRLLVLVLMAPPPAPKN